MEPTLKPGQSYLVYAWDKTVTRGDIVIVEDGKQGEAVKRIVGLPGETVRIDGAVWINHCRLHEPYLQPRMHTYPAYQNASEEYLLSQRQYFVMGDNRLVSEDSRDYGPISYSQIRGKLHALVGWP
jgi:signal peptidase I